MKLQGSLWLATMSAVWAQNGNHEHHHDMNHEVALSNRPHTHVMYHHVEKACAEDVEKLCTPHEEPPQFLQMGDPFLDWVFAPLAPPPSEVDDLPLLLDSMFVAAVSDAFDGYTEATFFWMEEPQEAPHALVDSVAAKVAAEKQPEEIPLLAKDLQEYGQQAMLQFEEDSVQHHMGRRLTEMDATTIQHHVRLPFGCQKNRCLRQAVSDGKVSVDCQRSIHQMEYTFELEEILEQRQDLFVGMMWVYIAVMSILLILLARKFRSQRSQRRLRLRVLQAVYSNPFLKRQVERELGESVGGVPPFPTHVLRQMSMGGKELKRRIRCMKRLHLLFLVALFTLAFVEPFLVLPVCIFVSLLRVIQLCLMPSESPETECECCCCGVSVKDVREGNVSARQECCECCKGTGVGSPACKHQTTDGCYCCSSDCCKDSAKARVDGCCCCCGATPAEARAGTLTVDQMCCCCCKGTGVACCGSCSCCKDGLKTTQDCTCCCCGATPSQARAGTLTDVQACCNCCKGTGVCDPACAACCGGQGCGCCCGSCSCCNDVPSSNVKGRGQKHVVLSEPAIYHGVPLQIV